MFVTESEQIRSRVDLKPSVALEGCDMLAEERLNRIVAVVDERGTVTSAELMELLNASESTVRRDLTRLAQERYRTRSTARS